MTDEINSPSHYMLFPDMQAIDVIEAALTPEEFAGYLKGNALKYRLRAGDKGPAEICLGKAEWYQDRLFQHYDGMGWSEDLKAKDEATFGQQNTIDCRTDEQKGFNDPRTVVGMDVSFPTEKHMNFAPETIAVCGYCLKEQCICSEEVGADHA